MRQPDLAQAWIALWGVQAENTRGVLPQGWNAQLLAQMLATPSTASEHPFVQLLAYYRRLSEDNEKAGLEHLENALRESSRCGKVFRQCLFLEAASCSVLVRGAAGQARVWLERACAVRKLQSTASVEASIAMCEKRYEEASRHLTAARAELERLKLNSGLARLAKEKLAEYQRTCSESIPASV